MASTYKTPGVYVEEISKIPPSVAEVDTAIPAFVGYTEKAKRYVDDDLHNIPTRLGSLLEYEQYFGAGPSYTDIHVRLTANSIVDSNNSRVENSKYNLYESMRLFFDNGGGTCYVCSAGKYSAGDLPGARATNMTNALAEVRKYDEPTILLFPDAMSLNDGTPAGLNLIASLQQAALKQSGDLGDRFAVLDVPEVAGSAIDQAASFRSKIGMNNLKYGAAYMPFLTTTYDKNFQLRDICKNLYDYNDSKIDLKSLFTDSDKDATGVLIKDKLDSFTQIYNDNDAMNSRLALFSGKTVADNFDANSLDTKFQSAKNIFNGATSGAPGDATRKTALKAAFEFVHAAIAQVEGLTVFQNTYSDTTNSAAAASGKPIRTAALTNSGLKSSVETLISTNLKSPAQALANLDFEAYRKPSPEISNVGADQPTTEYTLLFTGSAWGGPITGALTPGLISGADITAKGSSIFAQLAPIYQAAKAALSSAVSIGLSYEDANQKALIPDLPIYNSIVTVLNGKVNTIPPSGAIAGIYASVDINRGVWKAPANVSINSVGDLSELIEDNTQSSLNIDPDAGKSINAIRAFFGKGIVVWGARTLAGNDNEWRYVPVRRFFNFVEESCKKSTGWCVFEPNDANTWARIRSQISNFLNTLWRKGALAGAKPDQAYYVNCGLGVTMTSQDVLEGRLYVEIGMAAVRPAEFVILRFSHIIQQS